MNTHEAVKAAAVVNGATWTTRLVAHVTVQDVGSYVGIVATLFSICVSIVTLLWLRKQMRGYDKDHGSRS